MSEEQKSEQSAAPSSSDERDSRELNSPNPLASRARADIYKRFDAQPPTDYTGTSPEKEESKSDSDSKEESVSEQHSEKVLETTETPTSEKKGKEPVKEVKKAEEPEEQKTVPLQALHEARERFRKVNLEYRDYKKSQEKEFTALKEQLAKLTDKLNSSEPKDMDEPSEREQQLLNELASLRKQVNSQKTSQDQDAVKKAQEEYQKRISSVTEELTKEGYPGFDIALIKTGAKLQEMVAKGDLTEAESTQPDTWKKVYKEEIFSDVKSIFSEKAKEELFNQKKTNKKQANLVADPGKPPEEEKKADENEALSYDDFVKKSMQDRMKAHKKKFYKR